MANVKYFYGTKRAQHSFFLEAVNEIEKGTPDTADLVLIGPPMILKKKANETWLNLVYQFK